MGCANTKSFYQYPQQSYPIKKKCNPKDKIITENQTFQIVKNPIFQRRKDSNRKSRHNLEQNQNLGNQDTKLISM
ncbi:unnamed protein product [Paramecium octaurelia]|uniref:Uncharacterized protein n=1 Tax=Paramecium octaurelia TaxID=43137 RepID=A0A8S1WZR9_PAROT|nr:unnamed protein product [Paramecium octaurelia]